jgi:hypothetical protein
MGFTKMLSSQSVSPAMRRFENPVCLLLALLLLIPALAFAGDTKLSDHQRQQIIREFLAERPFVHRAFPRGKVGIRIEGDKITPSEAELKQLVARSGPAAKPGERARITAVHFVHHGIVFEINGGPVKRKKWTDRISIGTAGASPAPTPPSSRTPPSPNDDPSASQPATDSLPTDADVYNNATGSFVFLAIKDDASSLTTDQIKEQLAPVLDFKAMSVAEAYQKSLPPVLAAAVKNHHALVGMDKDMVTYAMGRPPRRIRETKDGLDYEEWIYGAPPQDVEFIRFLGDKAVSIEDMKVSGEKLVRTQDELGDLKGTISADASDQKKPRPDAAATPAEDDRRGAPTLLRPDEKPVIEKEGQRPSNPAPPPDSPTSAPPSRPD